MDSQRLTLQMGLQTGMLPTRRFLVLFLPTWPTDYLKRRDSKLAGPMALYERIKGGLRLAVIDAAAGRAGLSVGQNLADARAMVPGLTVLELDRPLLEAAFADFADWHSNASPLVAVMSDVTSYGDLVLDITGVAHLFGGERAMLRMLLTRLRELGYAVSGAIAPTIGAAWAVSHFARSQVVEPPISILCSIPCLPPPCGSTRPRLPGSPRWGSRVSANCGPASASRYRPGSGQACCCGSIRLVGRSKSA